MLQELEEGVMHFIINKKSVSLSENKELMKNWDVRFQLIQVRQVTLE